MKLFVSDLDNTLIYSYRREIGPERRLVETLDGKELSFMTDRSHRLLSRLRERYCIVPSTTRSLSQYRRICFFGGGDSAAADGWLPEYALTSNGGLLLRRGEIDEDWRRESHRLCMDAEDGLLLAEAVLAADPSVSHEIIRVDGFFVFTKSDDPEGTLELLDRKLRSAGTEQSVLLLRNGSKVYAVPAKLNKGMALVRLRRLLDAEYVIAAGDSEFDIPMLLEADEAWFPQALDRGPLSAHPRKHAAPAAEIFSDVLLSSLAGE